MAHQAHSVPWVTLAGHLKLKVIPDGSWVPGVLAALFRRRKPEEANDVAHFARCLARAIGEFADTERAKHPVRYPVEDGGRLFARDVIDRNVGWLAGYSNTTGCLPPTPPPPSPPPPPPPTAGRSSSVQQPETSIPWAEMHAGAHMESWIRNVSAADGELPYDHMYNELVMLLLAEGEMGPLLRLAQHPKLSLARLRNTGMNQQARYDDMATLALEVYLFLNIMYCLLPRLWRESDVGGGAAAADKDGDNGGGGNSGRKWDYRYLLETGVYKNLFRRIECMWTSRAKFMPHLKWMLPDRDAWWGPRETPFDPFKDLDRLREHAKECFRIVVRCEVLEREHDKGIDWEAEILFLLELGYGLKGTLTYLEVRNLHDPP